MTDKNPSVQDRIELCGLTQQEASVYLKARGHAASVGAIAAWGKGHYSPAQAVLDDLEGLLWIVENTHATEDEKGVALPEGALRRRAKRRGLRRTDFSDLKALLGDAPPPEPPDDID